MPSNQFACLSVLVVLTACSAPTPPAPSSGNTGGRTATGGAGGRSAMGGTGGSTPGTGGAPLPGAGGTLVPGTGGDPSGSGGSAPPEAAPELPDATLTETAIEVPASPAETGPEPAGTTVLELRASGGNPYALFAAKDLLPIDGPSSGYITDTGSSFLFVLHENGAEETVSSGARRQRNELTVNPGNPAIYKGMRGDTMRYTWRFRLTEMNAEPTWCDIFQIKQHGPLGVAPYLAFEANKGNLTFDTEKLGVVRTIPLSAVMNVWVNASVTIHFADAGALAFRLTRDDGSVIVEYNNDRADMWDTTVDFVRPKWGLYRNKRAGAGEAAIHYNEMKIIRLR